VQVVAHEQDRPILAPQLGEVGQASPLKLRVAHGEHLVEHQDLTVEVSRHGEGQPQEHAGRIPLDRSVEEPPHPGEVDDLAHPPIDVTARQPQDRPTEADVLASGQFRMEARARLEDRADPAPGAAQAARRFGDPTEDLEQRRLAGAVAADDPQ
jgi:hypothetical protein